MNKFLIRITTHVSYDINISTCDTHAKRILKPTNLDLSILRKDFTLQSIGNNSLCHTAFFVKSNAPVENRVDR